MRNVWLRGVVIGQLIMQYHIQQGLMHTNATVVFDEAKLAKAIHEEADAGSYSTDHIRQGLLRDLGNQGYRLALHAEFRHQQENPGEALFAGVEELIDKISLNAHAAAQQKRQEQVGEGMFFMHDSNHLFPSNLECRAGTYSSGGCKAHSKHRGQRLLSDEIAGREERDRGLFAAL